MILAIDVYYKEAQAKTVGVLFDWEDDEPQKIITSVIENVEEYVPGQFFKRELPCVTDLLNKLDLNTIDLIIVDGHVFVDNQNALGLGGHLYESLQHQIPVVGVAKRSFHNTEKVSFPVYRGKSGVPLYVSCIGIEIESVIENIKNMKGEFRLPAILKIMDQETKKEN
ncbi:endonuclease V [Flavobacterium sp.]|uniref:endonuclease V n=1 Tax=Flavobacterium sp. TaxID=239 RepID=UPI003D6C0ED2